MKFYLENFNEPKLLEEEYNTEKLAEELHKQLDKLSPRHKKLIEMRHFENKSIAECAEYFGISIGRVRQIEEDLYRKLRHPARSSLLQRML